MQQFRAVLLQYELNRVLLADKEWGRSRYGKIHGASSQTSFLSNYFTWPYIRHAQIPQVWKISQGAATGTGTPPEVDGTWRLESVNPSRCFDRAQFPRLQGSAAGVANLFGKAPQLLPKAGSRAAHVKLDVIQRTF